MKINMILVLESPASQICYISITSEWLDKESTADIIY